MKLAEALQERADLNRKIEELRRRLNNVILVQEGEEPAEDPAELLGELDKAVARLEQLMAAINLTNCRTKVNGMTLTALIARKDALKNIARNQDIHNMLCDAICAGDGRKAREIACKIVDSQEIIET